MRLKILAATAAALLFAGAAAAADADGNYFIMGDLGAMTCGDINAKSGDFEMGAKIGAWATGYITALNRLTPNTYNIAPDPEALFVKLFDACKAKPELHLEPALWEVAKALYPARVQKKP